MTEKDAARQKIAALVEKWRATTAKQREGYSERDTQNAFILPLFEALGWNIQNPSEVSGEEQISRGFVDFGFYFNGVPAFYLETKRAAEKLEKPEFMRQSINYAYLKGVTWAVLSDFEQLMVFNAEWETTDPIQARFLDLHWEHYANGNFDDLWLLSKPAFTNREIDRTAERFGKKAKKQPVTDTLFKQLTTWRREMFEQMRVYGGVIWSTNPRQVDNAVQKLLDRLIFIRTVEDRGVEPPRLQAVLRQSKNKDLFGNLLKLFRELDVTYNSNLFAQSELDLMEVHDPDLIIEMVNGLYKAPGGYISYDFNAITADVLGAVYEQYLGFKAQDPQGKQALDPRKQEKRKKQGIYYTPQFVVRYIVRQTLGKLLESGVDPHSLRILDPACGSGSFLIEAFDVLDRWLAQNGTAEDKQFPRRRRLRILQENLYGVDLDEQAVEVTRLNLMLRAAQDRAKLPPLNHIQRGNSLIDADSIAGDTAFNWINKFPEINERDGFDIIIGNPPYIRIQTLPKTQLEWLHSRFESVTASYDIYIPFVERGLSLLNPNGLMGYILPHKFFNAQYGAQLRQLIARGQHLQEIVHFGDQQVFEGATTYTCILILSKSPHETFKFNKVQNIDNWKQNQSDETSYLLESPQGSDSWNFSPNSANRNLLNKLLIHPIHLNHITDKIFQGLVTSADSIYILENAKRDNDLVFGYSKAIGEKVALEADVVVPLMKGSVHIRRYGNITTDRYVIFPYNKGGANSG